ncbi:gem-associated protein 5 isoform X2 [Macrosteles quadrilineatus]|uniref:gem-associated protein 5 isoform X2 n=1 Tax=Macrosteles quadrilineatus TaxID=74068 RepID=UPI0023E131EB|nr:gem-associated protein 5 isoform X2 [Macrosteles quadrilineatus]
MDTRTLPPSPSWQLSNILACNDDGLLAYGARSDLSLIDFKAKGQFDVSFINRAHKDKVNVVVFSPSNGSFKNCLATCGDDGSVRVWDFKESQQRYCHSGHKDGLKITGLDWSKADTNRIVSVNDLGVIVCWDLASNTIRRLHCGIKILPLCLACCPNEKELIAIGCKNGITLVVDTKGNGKIVHRLRGHEQDVISISWCPVPYNVIRHKRNMDPQAGGDSDVKSRDLLLATGGVEKSIFIWRTGSDGRFEVVLNLPPAPIGNTSNRKKAPNQLVLWTSVLWADPYTLLSTSQFGELLSWDLNKVFAINDKANHKRPQPRLLHSRHNKGCFSIATPVLTETLDKGDERLVWTTAMDKHVLASKITTGSVILDIPTMGGAVYCMAISPLDPNRLAIGSSDSKVFVWNLGDQTNLQISSYWKKIIGKVMALCWHPREENWLAYGTSDGHVGLIDLDSNKLPVLFRLHHRKQVYRLCWAAPLIPADTDHKDQLALYSVGDGDILQYAADINNPNKEPISLNTSVLNAIDASLNFKKNLVRSEIVFKHDNSCFAVGNENGSMYILSCKTVNLLHVVYPHKKLMNNLEWHPETVASDNNISPYKDWLATTCENIKVYNIPAEGQPELVATLSGHSMKIVGLAWSPHYNGRLLSTSYDSSVQIYDVPSQSCMGVYLKHTMSVMCGYFSPLDPNIVISGSSDNTVRLWHMSELQAPSTCRPEKKKDIEKLRKKQTVEVQEATELTVDNENPSKHNTSANSSMNSNSHSPTSSNKSLEDFRKRQKSRNMFSVTGTKLAQAKHFNVLYQRWSASRSAVKTEVEEKVSVEELGYLDFFGDDKSMPRLLMVEENHLSTQGLVNIQLVQQSMLWRGQVSQLLTQAITKKQLSDWLVSLAPMAGFDMWEKASEAYSAQLVECGEVVKGSSYLLQINKVHEAVRLLADYKMYREAIAIAKCRLAHDDELTTEVYTEWATTTRQQGSLQLAAHCFLAAGNIQACIETLARDKELKSLKMAATLASQHGFPELASSLATECLTMAVLAGNLAVGLELVNSLPQFQSWCLWLAAAEVVSKVKNRSEIEAISWVTGLRQAPISLWDHLTTSCASLGSTYHKLLTHLSTNKTPEFERDVWYIVSGQLAAAWGAQSEATPAHCLRHLVSALSAAFHYQNNHPSSTVTLLTLAVMAPHGIFSKESILTKEYETLEEKQLMKSLKAFVCASIIHWLNNNWNKVATLRLKSSGQSNAEESTIEEIDFKVEWLVDLITKYSPEVLDGESISFFVKKAQKEELLSRVTAENIKKSAVRKSDSKEKTNQTQNKVESSTGSKLSDSKNQEAKKTEENLNLTRENKECPSVEHQNEQIEMNNPETDKQVGSCVPDKTQENSNGKDTEQRNAIVTQSTTSSVEKNSENVITNTNGNMPNQGSNGSIEKEHAFDAQADGDETISKIQDNSEKCVPNDESNGIVMNQGSNGSTENERSLDAKSNGEDKLSKLQELKKLEETISQFESTHVSVPSPFTFYANIKYLLDQVVSKQDPKVAQQLQENCDNLWKKSQQ